MKEQKIKPCPFCGSTDIDYGKCLTNKTRTGKEFFVKCENCGTEVNVSYNTFDETNLALEMWNNAKCANEKKVNKKSTNLNSSDYEEIAFAISCVRKQMPMKPKRMPEPIKKHFSTGVDGFYCPVCDSDLIDMDNDCFDYCPHCGQKINWSDAR